MPRSVDEQVIRRELLRVMPTQNRTARGGNLAVGLTTALVLLASVPDQAQAERTLVLQLGASGLV